MAFGRGSRVPVPSSPPARSCPRGSAGTGTTACSRGSRPRSSPRAAGRRCSRGFCRVVFGLVRSFGVPLLRLASANSSRLNGKRSRENPRRIFRKCSLFSSHHLARLVERVVAMTHDVDQRLYSVLSASSRLRSHACRQIAIAEKAGGLLHDAAQHVEVDACRACRSSAPASRSPSVAT